MKISLIIGQLMREDSAQEPKMSYYEKIYWSLAKENGEIINTSLSALCRLHSEAQLPGVSF